MVPQQAVQLKEQNVNTNCGKVRKVRKRYGTLLTSQQQEELNKIFIENPSPKSTTIFKISLKLKLSENKIKIWFRNRRKMAKQEASPTTTSYNPTIPITVQNYNFCNNIQDKPASNISSPAATMMPPALQVFSTSEFYHQNDPALTEQTGYENVQGLNNFASYPNQTFEHQNNFYPLSSKIPSTVNQTFDYQNINLQGQEMFAYQDNVWNEHTPPASSNSNDLDPEYTIFQDYVLNPEMYTIFQDYESNSTSNAGVFPNNIDTTIANYPYPIYTNDDEYQNFSQLLRISMQNLNN